MCVCVCFSVCEWVLMCVHCVCMCVHMCMCVYMCVCLRVCVYMHTYHDMHLEVGGQLLGNRSFLLPCGSQDWNFIFLRLGSRHLYPLSHLTSPWKEVSFLGNDSRAGEHLLLLQRAWVCKSAAILSAHHLLYLQFQEGPVLLASRACVLMCTLPPTPSNISII